MPRDPGRPPNQAKLRVVEDVESLGAELESNSLLDHEVLEKRHVEIACAADC